MKKLLSLTVLSLLFCNLFAQNLSGQKDKQSEDIFLLQKSNALLKNQLNEQKHILFNQIQKTDSIVSTIQSANSDIEKIVAHQNAITDSIQNFTKQTTNISQGFSNISETFSKRKLYAIIAVISSIFIVLFYLLYLKKKLFAMNKDIQQKEENFSKKIFQMNGYVGKEIGEIKFLFEKLTKEINMAIEKQNAENKKAVTKLSEDTNENLSKMKHEVNKTMESRITLERETFQEQHSKSAAEFSEKITELNNAVEKKIAIIQNEYSTNFNEIIKRLEKTSL